VTIEKLQNTIRELRAQLKNNALVSVLRQTTAMGGSQQEALERLVEANFHYDDRTEELCEIDTTPPNPE
jgi:hypothetical protein